ncbi:hypothetical protein R84981_000979 [Carnimonas sp. R-84981]
MDAGKLRDRVVIQRRINDRDPLTGGVIERWDDLDSLPIPASIQFLSAREFIAAQATQSQVTARITIRFRPDIRPTMRVIFKARGYERIFNIKGVLPDKHSGGEYLTLPCSEGDNDGQ